jgi:hypothetical protein
MDDEQTINLLMFVEKSTHKTKAQQKEEFFSIITHKDTSNIVYFDDGETGFAL